MKRLSLFIVLFSFLFPIKTFSNDIFPYTKVVYLGDSLTDNGNLYNAIFHIIPKTPPYYQGRFSNGLVWSDHLTNFLKSRYQYLAFENHAVGGETVLPHTISEGHLPWTLAQSIDQYFKHIDEDDSHTLYFVWIGANDYNGGSSDVDGLTSQVVNEIHYNIERLIKHGAKHFVILNLPDLSRTPAAKENGLGTTLYALTFLHNTKLAGAMFQLEVQHPDVAIGVFDIFNLFTALLDQTTQINQHYHTHITNTSTACWTGSYALNEKKLHQKLMTEFKTTDTLLEDNILHNPDLSAAYQVSESYENNVVPCANADDYLFWDRVHPTAVTHVILSDVIQHYILA